MSQVSDYNIANASGASVRSDLNAVFDAIKTLNSGGTDPSNPEAFMPYVDTADNNNLKIRNSANNGFTTVGPVNSANLGLLPRSGGTMTGQILGQAGANAGSPAYAFGNDSDTGMFRSDSNKISFSVGGANITTLESNGLFINAIGNVAKGLYFNDNDNSAHVKLRAPDTVSSNITLRLPASITNGGFLQTDSAGNLSFQTVNGVPIGSVFCIAHTSKPSGYLECNGDALPNGTGTVQGVTANFAPLRALIGASLPDLRGEFIRGFDNGRGVDSGRSMLQHQDASNNSHNHSISLSGTTSNKSLTGNVSRISETFAGAGQATGVFSKGGNNDAPLTPGGPDSSPTGSFNFNASHDHTFSASGTSGNQGGEARPRNVAMMYIIKF